MPVSFEPLLYHLPAWLLVFFRLTGMFLIGPILGSALVLGRFKILLALVLSLCIYPLLLDPQRPSAALIGPVLDDGLRLWMLPGQVAMELAVGFFMGLALTIPMGGVQIAGQLIDQQLGLGLAMVYNPEAGANAGVIAQFLFMLSLAIFLVLGGHRAALTVMVDSFQSVPLGGFGPDPSVLGLLLGLLKAMFDVAIQIAAPVLCIIFIETLAMGFIARTVPQMNILSIGFPLRILVGMIILIGAVGGIADLVADSFERTVARLVYFFTV